jgi:hypothetical protein
MRGRFHGEILMHSHSFDMRISIASCSLLIRVSCGMNYFGLSTCCLGPLEPVAHGCSAAKATPSDGTGFHSAPDSDTTTQSKDEPDLDEPQHG